MKTASWSLALVAAAGTVRATEEDCPEESSVPAYPAVSSSLANPISSVPAYPAVSSSWAAPVSSVPVYPAGSSSSAAPASSEAGAYSSTVYSSAEPSGPVIVTNTKTLTKYVCPCEGATRTPGEVYTTLTTTEWTSTCSDNGHEATYTWGDWTTQYTSYEVSTITDTITVTLTEPYPSSVAAYSSSGLPAGYSGWSASGSSVEPASASGSWSIPVYPSASASSGEPASASGSWSIPVYPSASGSSAAAVSGSASWSIPVYSSASASSAAPVSGSGSWSASSSASSAWGTGVSSSYYPSGTGYSSSRAWGTGTAYSSSSYYPSSSSVSSAAPTGTAACVPCEGQPGNNPDEWCGLTIHDNWYEVVPKTCKTREYYWSLTSETISPDGVPRLGMLINGQMPGPKIEANWGDEIIVHLTNNFAPDLYNGTSLHFHGIRQNYTNEMDGVSSITQCPIAPGKSMTYKWTATSYGTSWWHSHFALQTYEGVFGPIVINGPAAMPYDDEVVVLAQDWNHNTVDSLYYPSMDVTSPTSGPQTLDTGLINGMNVFGTTGQRFQWTVESGKSYRIRLVNTAIQSTFVFYVDGHTLSVIAMDFVPITPYQTDSVVINIGQRYDLIMKADQASADYWMRADNQQPCGQLKNLDIKGIVHYADGPNSSPDPSTPPLAYAPTCLDEPSASLVPIVPLTAGAVSQTIEETVVIGPNNGNPNLFKWTLSGTTFYSQWENPTLQSIVNDGTVPDTSGNLAIEVPNLGEWVYVIIETPIPLPHPIHLHGHDFFILAQGLGSYTDATPLNLNNPPRRDVAVMPADPVNNASGFLVVAFETNNPGVWLMHCHIGWHNAMGFALQIIENLEGIQDTVKYGGVMDETCNAWVAYADAYNVFASTTYESGV